MTKLILLGVLVIFLLTNKKENRNDDNYPGC